MRKKQDDFACEPTVRVSVLPISTPAGPCPVKLTSTEPERVLEWADTVQVMGERQGKHYTPAAVQYFVRQFIDIHSPDYKRVCEILNGDNREADDRLSA